MEYVRIVSDMTGADGGSNYFSPEKGYILIAIAVVVIVIGIILMKKPK